MNVWIDPFYYFITGTSLLLSVMGLWVTALIPGIDRWDRRFFLSYFFVLLLSGVCVLVEMILHAYPVPGTAILGLLFLETLLASLPLPMQTAYLLHCCGESLRTSKHLRAVLGLWAVFLVLLVSIPFVDGFVYFTPEYGYTHGPLYPLFFTPSITILLLNFAATFRHRARLSRKAFLSFIIAQVSMVITFDFTNYLRRNFNAVASDSAIPFATELEHTRAYLAVEQAQYDDMLVVDYDTPYTQFRLPPLTLQPVVENAVKHGMDPDGEPLNISIRTRHTDSGTEIIVEDTGPGFDPSDESKPHTTLNNIRQRLEMMCRGTMTITPRGGVGNVVKVTIPG